MSYLKRIAKPINTFYKESQLKKLNNVLYKNMAKIICGNKEIEPYISYSINIPLTVDSFVYDGTEKTPTWVGFDSGIMAVSGDTSATNAGEYTVTFTLIDNRYFWVDGTTTPKQVTWSIAQAEDAITFAANPFTVEANFDQTTTASTLSGAVAVVDKDGYDHTVAQVTNRGGSNLNVQGFTEGTVDVPLNVNDSSGNYKPASATLTVNVVPSKTYLSKFTVPNTATSFGINKLT